MFLILAAQVLPAYSATAPAAAPPPAPSGASDLASKMKSFNQDTMCTQLLSSDELEAVSQLAQAEGKVAEAFKRTKVSTSTFETVSDRSGVVKKDLLKKYVIFSQKSAILELSATSGLSSEPLQMCIARLQDELLTDLSELPGLALTEKGLPEALAPVETAMQIPRHSTVQLAGQATSMLQVHNGPSAVDWIMHIYNAEDKVEEYIGFNTWDPIREYLKYSNGIFVFRAEPVRKFMERIDLYLRVLKMRSNTAERLVEGKEKLVQIRHFLANHYGFVLLTSELFRESVGIGSPGRAGSQAEVFAFDYLSQDLAWLTDFKDLLGKCSSSADFVGAPTDLIAAGQAKINQIIGKQKTQLIQKKRFSDYINSDKKWEDISWNYPYLIAKEKSRRARRLAAPSLQSKEDHICLLKDNRLKSLSSTSLISSDPITSSAPAKNSSLLDILDGSNKDTTMLWGLASAAGLLLGGLVAWSCRSSKPSLS